MQANRIVCGDAVEVLRGVEAGAIALTVFSPPYDALRDYEGFSLDLGALGDELYRVTADGGVVVMVIQDQTRAGRKTLTSFRTIVDWCDRVGFGLWECAIYRREGVPGGWWKTRLRVDHEYMPIFVKGDRPRHFDKSDITVPCVHQGTRCAPGARCADGSFRRPNEFVVGATKCRGTVWDFKNTLSVVIKRAHPAVFPDNLARDFIAMFSRPGDIVLDPTVGSGSTLVAAKVLGRRWFGIDISENYCARARKRVDEMHTNLLPGRAAPKVAPDSQGTLGFGDE